MTRNELIDRLARRLESSKGFDDIRYVDTAGNLRKSGLELRRRVISSVFEGIVEEVQEAVRDKIPVRFDGLISLTPELRDHRVRDWETKKFEVRKLWFLRIRPADKLIDILRGRE